MRVDGRTIRAMAGADRRSWTRRHTSLLALLLLLAGCGEGSSVATWEVDPDDQLTASTTTFSVIVTRTGCSSGEQGQPETPAIEYTETQVRITFRIRPAIDSGTCEGVPGVPYEVTLSEPIGDRSLVDGECQPGSEAWATAFCMEEGVRYSND